MTKEDLIKMCKEAYAEGVKSVCNVLIETLEKMKNEPFQVKDLQDRK